MQILKLCTKVWLIKWHAVIYMHTIFSQCLMKLEINVYCFVHVHEKLKFLWHELAWMAGGVYSVPSKSYDIKAVCLWGASFMDGWMTPELTSADSECFCGEWIHR